MPIVIRKPPFEPMYPATKTRTAGLDQSKPDDRNLHRILHRIIVETNLQKILLQNEKKKRERR